MNQLESARQALELKLFELTQKSEDNSRAIAESNKHIARNNFIASCIIGVAVIILALVQIYLSARPAQIIVQQIPQQQSAEQSK